MPGRTIYLDTRTAKPTEPVVGAGGGCFDIFHSPIIRSFLFSFFLFLEDGTILLEKEKENPKSARLYLPFDNYLYHLAQKVNALTLFLESQMKNANRLINKVDKSRVVQVKMQLQR